MAVPLRHRQTKGAATAMFYLMPPRHISTLHFPDFAAWCVMSAVEVRADEGRGRLDFSFC
jgi:hypothetical protein